MHVLVFDRASSSATLPRAFQPELRVAQELGLLNRIRRLKKALNDLQEDATAAEQRAQIIEEMNLLVTDYRALVIMRKPDVGRRQQTEYSAFFERYRELSKPDRST